MTISPYCQELEMECVQVAKSGRVDRIESQEKKINQAFMVGDIIDSERLYLLACLSKKSPH